MKQSFLKIIKFSTILFVVGFFFFTNINIAFAAIAHDATTENPTTGTGGCVTNGSCTFNHTPVGTPRGVLIYVYYILTDTDPGTTVTYGGVSVPAVSSGSAADTVTEKGRVTAYYLGSSIPTGQQSVVVTRTGTTAIYVTVTTVTSNSVDTEVTGTTLQQENGSIAESSITDGSPGTNSMRFHGCYSGSTSITAGANSTLLQSYAISTTAFAASVRETTAGQGARNSGCVAGNDDRAVVSLAVRERRTVSGTANGNNGATVKIAVNGVVQTTTPASPTIASSAWTATIPSSLAANDIVTAWVDGVNDANEATAVTKWSSGDITGMVLNDGVATVGSNQDTSVSVTNMGLCDADTGCSDEDIIYTSNSGALVLASSSAVDTLSILSGDTLTANSASSETISAEVLTNAGTITCTSSPTITLSGTSGTLFTNTGTFTQATSTVTLSGDGNATITSNSPTFYNLTSSGTGVKTLGAGITIASSGTLTVSAGTFDPSTFLVTGSGTNTLAVSSGATIRVGASTFAGSYSSGFGTITLNAASTTDYNLGGTQTVSGTPSYGHLTISGSGTKTLGGTTSVAGNLTVSAGTLQLADQSITVTGTSSITGTIDDNNTTGTDIFVGKVTINNAGTWTSTGNESYEFRGGLDANSTSTFTSGSGTYTFSTNAQTVDGTQSITITNISNTITSSTGLTFSDNGVTVGTLTQGTNSILTFSGTTIPAITTLDASTNANTVVYSVASGGQTIKASTYRSLTLSNTSGTNTAGGNIVVNTGTMTTTAGGTLDMTSAYTLSGSATFTNNGTIKTAVPTATSATPLPTGKTWAGTIQYSATSGAQTVVQGTYNNLTVSNTSATDTAGGTLTVNGTLTTTSGGTLDMSTYQLLGTVTPANNGTITTSNTTSPAIPASKDWTGTTGVVTFAVTSGGQYVPAGTYKTLNFSNTSGTDTGTGAITATTLTTTSGGTLNLATYDLAVTNITNNGTIQTQSSSATPLTSGKTWGGTVSYNRSGAQTVVSGTYDTLEIDGSGVKTLAASINVNTILHTINTAIFDPTESYTVTGDGSTELQIAAFSTVRIPKATYAASYPSFTSEAHGVLAIVEFSRNGDQTIPANKFTAASVHTSGSGTKTLAGDNSYFSMTIGSGTTLDLSSYTMTIIGDGDDTDTDYPLVATGTFTASTGTVKYTYASLYWSNALTIPVTNISYKHLTIAPDITAASKTYSLPGMSITGDLTINPTSTAASKVLTVNMQGNVTVAGTTTITGSGGGSGPASSTLVMKPSSQYNITTGTLAIGANGTLDAATNSSTSSITITGTGSAFTNSGTFSVGGSNVLFTGDGSVTIPAISYYDLSLTPTITSGRTYTLNATTVTHDFTVNPTAASSLALTVNMGATLAVTGATTLTGTTSGTSVLDTRPSSTDYNISTGTMSIGAAGTLDMTSAASTVTLTGTGTVWSMNASGTINPGTSTISLTDSSASAKTFAGAGKTYNNLTLAGGAGTGAYTLSGDNTFATFADTGTGAHTINFTASSTTTVTAFTIESATSSVITMQSTSGGSYWNLVDTDGGTNQVRYVSLTDSCASGSGVTWDAYTYSSDNTNGGHNCGWVFTASISVSGTANFNNGETVKLAINGTPDNTHTGTISGSAWSITGVTQPSVDDIITVWVDNAPSDGNETTAVTKWASGNVTGMVLNTNVLTIGSNQDTNVYVSELGSYDADDDGDIMHTVNSGALLVQGASNVYTDETLSILSGDTLTARSASSESITTEKITNAGTLVATGSPTINLAGTSGTLFTNTGTFTRGTSIVNITGNGDATINSDVLNFHDLVLSGTGTKSISEIIGIVGDMTVSAGTFEPSTHEVFGTTSTLTVSAGATINVGASTFAGNYDAGFDTFDLAPTSTVNYNASGAQTVSGTPSYGHLTISGSGTKTLGANTGSAGTITVSAGTLDTDSGSSYSLSAKNISVGASGTLNINSSTVTISGTTGTLLTNAGTFNAGSGFSEVHMNPNASVTLTSGDITFKTLRLNPTLGGSNKTYTFGSGNIVSSTLNIQPGGGAFNLAVNMAVNLSGSDLLVGPGDSATTSLVTKPSSTSYNLTFDNITIGAGGTLDASGSTSTITLTGTDNSTRLSNSGTITPGSSTFVFTANSSPSSALISGAGTFYNLSLTPTITGNRTYTLGGSSISIANDFTINPTAASSNTLTVNLSTNITVTGTTTITGTTSGLSSLDTRPSSTDYDITTGLMVIGANGTLDSASSSSNIILNGTSGTLWTQSGTFNTGTSIVKLASLTTSTINSSPTTFYNLQINNAGTYTAGADINVNNVYVANTGYLDAGDYTITASSGFTFSDNGRLKVKATTVAGNYVAPDFSCAVNFYIDFYRSGDQTVINPCTSDLKLITSGSGTKTLGANSSFETATIGSGTTLDLDSYTLTLSGTSTPITATGTFTASTGKVAFAGDGSVTIPALSYYDLYVTPTITADRTYTLNATTVTHNFTINPTAASSTKVLTVNMGANLTVTGATTVDAAGTSESILDTKPAGTAYNITTGTMTVGATGTLDMTSAASTITLTGTGTVWNMNASGTINPGTSTIKINNASGSDKTFAGAGKTYYNIWFTGAGTGDNIITGSNTFNDLKDDVSSVTASNLLSFTAGTTTTISSLTVSGVDGTHKVTMRSTTPTTQWNLVDTSGTNQVRYVSITDSCASGGATWDGYTYASDNTDGGNNCGWSFVTLITVSGTANGNDAATVKVAVNSTLDGTHTGTISSSAWTINVPQPTADDIITVWVDGVGDVNEAVAVTKYVSGNVSGMVLNDGVLTIGSDQNTSVSATNLGLYDGSDDEDIIHTSTSGALATSGTVKILASNTLTVASGSTETVTAGKINNAGTITSTGSPTYTLTGTSGTLFTNTGTFTQATSEVVVTSASGTPTLLSDATTFHRLKINADATVINAGAAITMSSADATNRLYVQKGVLNDGGNQIVGTSNGTLVVDGGAALCIGGTAAGTNATCDSGATPTSATTFPTNYTNGNITLAVGGGGSSPTFTLVGHAGGIGTTSSFDSSGADLLVASFGGDLNRNISDSYGNTWVPLTQKSNNNLNSASRIWYVVDPIVGAGHTVTIDQNYDFIAVQAWSGGHMVPFDVQNGTDGSGSISSIQSGSVTPTEDNELVISALGQGETVTGINIDSGFTISDYHDGTINTDYGGGLAYKVQTTATAVNPTWSWTGSATVSSVIATFKVAEAPKYRSITIDHTLVPSTQTDFPVLISGTYSYLKTTANGGSVRNLNGYDIGFYSNSSLTSKLDWEREAYDPTTGEIVYWVKIPSLSSSSDTVIYMGYSDASIVTDQSDPAGVWGSNYEAVWHFGDGSTLSTLDSTSNNNDGTNSSVTAATGKVYGAGSFSGASQKISGSAVDLSNTPFTISAWIKPPSYTSDAHYFSLGDASTLRQGLHLRRTSDTGLLFGLWADDLPVTGLANNADTWVHVVVTMDSSFNQTMYVDGVNVGTRTAGGYFEGNTNWYIGGWTIFGQYWTGLIDEMELSTVDRGADWIEATYNNQNDPASFYEVGSESAASGSSSTVYYNANAATTVSSVPTYADLKLQPILTAGRTYTLGSGLSVAGDFDSNPNGGGSSRTLSVNQGGALTVSGTTILEGNNSGVTTLSTTGSNYALTSDSINITSGDTLNLNGSTFTLTGIGTPLTNAGTFTAGTSTTVFSGNGDATLSSAGVTFYNLTSSGTGTKTLGGATTVGGNLVISAGTLQIAGQDITVNGDTSITGTFDDNSFSGSNTFVGAVTINSGGIWTTSNDPYFEFRGGLTNNSSSGFTSGTGVYTFSTNEQTISGSQSFTISGQITNTIGAGNGLIFSGAQPTVSVLVQSSGGILTFSGAIPTITTLNATSDPNTVQYTSGSDQTIRDITYHHLVTSGSGLKQLGGNITVNGNLTVGSGTTLEPTASYMITGSGTNTLDATGELYVRASTFTGSYASFETKTFNSGSTVSYVSSDPQTVDSSLGYANLKAYFGTKTLDGDTAVTGNLTVRNDSIIDPTTSYTISGTGGSNTINVMNTGIILVKKSTFAGSYSGFETKTFDSGSTVNYALNGSQTVDNTLSYYNLTASGGSTAVKTLGGAMTIQSGGTLSADGAIFDPSTYQTTWASSTGTLEVNTNGTLRVGATNFSDNYSGYSSTHAGGSEPQTVAYTKAGSQTITTPVTGASHYIITGSGTKTAGSNLDYAHYLTLSGGTLNMGSYGLTAYTLTMNGGNLSAGSSDIELGSGISGTKTLFDYQSGTYTSDSETITLVNPSGAKTFAGGGQSFNKVVLAGVGGDFTISGDNTFNTLRIQNPPYTVKFNDSSTQTVTNWDVNGSEGAGLLTLKSTNDGNPWNIYSSVNNHAISSSYISLQDSVATGGASFYAEQSVNVSGNSGWTFAVRSRGAGNGALESSANSDNQQGGGGNNGGGGTEGTCSDGIQNGNETGVDTGGSCGSNQTEGTCVDGIQNGNETGVDTGGRCGNTGGGGGGGDGDIGFIPNQNRSYLVASVGSLNLFAFIKSFFFGL
jgi:hypothetical protein